jgi:hypothetical protein
MIQNKQHLSKRMKSKSLKRKDSQWSASQKSKPGIRNNTMTNNMEENIIITIKNTIIDPISINTNNPIILLFVLFNILGSKKTTFSMLINIHAFRLLSPN